MRHFAVEVRGELAHLGTTLLRSRRDALSAAIAMIAVLEAMAYDPTDAVRFTGARVLAAVLIELATRPG